MDHVTNQMVIKPFWKFAGWLGMRRLTGFLQANLEDAYGDTLSYFATDQPIIGLTIDDGLSRGGPATSMAPEVLQTLKKYEAHATFFVCTDYLKDQENHVHSILQDGHELGNHMQADRSFYYSKLSRTEFRSLLLEANDALEALENTSEGVQRDSKTRWFRAPQGILTKEMRDVLIEEGSMRHVLGDCYCDDWRFAQAVDDKDEEKRTYAMGQVADLMLAQVETGSIAIFHMPEQGFRQGTLVALELFLQGIQEKGWKCLCLTEMEESQSRARET